MCSLTVDGAALTNCRSLQQPRSSGLTRECVLLLYLTDGAAVTNCLTMECVLLLRMCSLTTDGAAVTNCRSLQQPRSGGLADVLACACAEVS